MRDKFRPGEGDEGRHLQAGLLVLDHDANRVVVLVLAGLLGEDAAHGGDGEAGLSAQGQLRARRQATTPALEGGVGFDGVDAFVQVLGLPERDAALRCGSVGVNVM